MVTPASLHPTPRSRWVWYPPPAKPRWFPSKRLLRINTSINKCNFNSMRTTRKGKSMTSWASTSSNRRSSSSSSHLSMWIPVPSPGMPSDSTGVMGCSHRPWSTNCRTSLPSHSRSRHSSSIVFRKDKTNIITKKGLIIMSSSLSRISSSNPRLLGMPVWGKSQVKWLRIVLSKITLRGCNCNSMRCWAIKVNKVTTSFIPRNSNSLDR